MIDANKRYILQTTTPTTMEMGVELHRYGWRRRNIPASVVRVDGKTCDYTPSLQEVVHFPGGYPNGPAYLADACNNQRDKEPINPEVYEVTCGPIGSGLWAAEKYRQDNLTLAVILETLGDNIPAIQNALQRAAWKKIPTPKIFAKVIPGVPELGEHDVLWAKVIIELGHLRPIVDMGVGYAVEMTEYIPDVTRCYTAYQWKDGAWTTTQVPTVLQDDRLVGAGYFLATNPAFQWGDIP